MITRRQKNRTKEEDTKLIMVSKKALLIHIMGVSLFLLYDIALLVSLNQHFNIAVMLLYFTLHIGWFYVFALMILPQINKMSMPVIIKVLVVVVLIAGFAILLSCVRRIILLISHDRIDYSFSLMEFARNFWRSFYASLLGLCYWYVRKNVLKEREARIQLQLRAEAERLRAEAEQLRAAAEQRELKAENDHLRSQLNPHVMFNSLSFVYQKQLAQQPDASEPIILLSEIMDYALQPGDTNGNASLQEEADQIKRMIRLHQILNEQQLFIRVNITLENTARPVPPLLLHHFVENLLKHGVISDPANPATIDLYEAKGNIHFKSQNKINSLEVKGHHLGAANTRRRLQRHYPDKHTLHIREHNGYYMVELTLAI